MNPYKPEIHTFFIRPLLDGSREALGTETLARILSELGVTEANLRDPTGWVSLELVESLCEAISAETNDPLLLDRMFRAAISKRYLGAIYPLVRSFGSPAFTYQQVVSGTERFNKVGEYELAERGRRRVQLVYRPIAGAPGEKSDLICRGRRTQLASIPGLFDLPPATVSHPRCMARGDDACVYDITWRERDTRMARMLGVLVGAGGALGLGLAVGGASWTLAAITLAGAIGGWAVGRVSELRAELRDRAAEIQEHHDALTRMTADNERRYAELLEAKEKVEERVRQRTAELREASDRLAAALEELRTMSRAKEDFFANVSHELRTPLTLILAPLDDLVAGRAPPGGTERALDAMQRNATRLLELINQLLDLAKIDAGAMQTKQEPTDLDSLARTVTARFDPDAHARGVTLEVQTGLDHSPVMLDPTWIETALTNLVANAVRHARGEVTVRVVEAGGAVNVEVEDDGPGMPPEDMARIFDRFSRGSTSDGHVGTGLGLALVREAARLHDGEATVESTPGRGTTFRMTLARVSPPAGVAPAITTEAIPDRIPSIAAVPSDRREGPDADAPLALVVEDVDDLRHFIADVLGARYRVRTARNGREGLALALELRPSVVVTDVSMPEMDGIELTRALRAHDEGKTVPIILVTAHRTVTSVLEGFEAGADDYVPKPFHARELLARIDVHVRLRQMVRELAHRERLATLGVVAASVAHQVRNPLTVLMSGLPAMQRRLEGSLDPKTAELLDVMLGCAGRIERMTIDLLDLSRIDREEVGVVRPGEGLAAAARLVSAGTPPGVQIDCEIDERAALAGRAGDLNHVFLNLIDNAVRAVGDAGRVRIRGAIEGTAYVVRVSDSGPGIPEEARANVFQPFFTTRPAGEGTGLGLSIARRVVEQHGGTIDLGDSEFGGAEFVVRLPATDAADCVVTYGARSLPADDRR